MKVLLVSFLIDPRLGGGAATSAARLAHGLAQQGVEVVTVTTHGEPEPSLAIEDGIKAYAFRPRNLYWVYDKDEQPVWKKVVWQSIDTWNPSTYRAMRQIIATEKPDIIHVHKLRGLSPSVWAAAAAENCRPIVQTCRDYEIFSPEGTLNSRVGRLALRRHWSMRPYQALRRQWSNQVDIVTAPSRFTLETIVNMDFFGRAQKLVVPNTHGLTNDELDDLAGHTPQPSPSTSDLHLLYLGRLETPKGIEVLCRAFAELVDELPNIHLDIAGDGTKEAALHARYQNTPRMYFHGYLAGEKKRDLIARADVLVMPSIVREVFGNSIIEAYAHGKPVIASRIGGMPELIEEGITGLLVEPDNVASLQQAIRRLSAESGSAAAMGPACRRQAKQYTLEAVTTAYLAAYEVGMNIRSSTGRRADQQQPGNGVE